MKLPLVRVYGRTGKLFWDSLEFMFGIRHGHLQLPGTNSANRVQPLEIGFLK